MAENQKTRIRAPPAPLFALANSALINMIMASRLIYGMSVEGVMPSFLAKVHSRRRTPWVAILFTTLVAMGLIASGDVGPLARTTVVLLLTAFIIVNISVLVLRRDKVEHDHFRAPVAFPLLGILVCAGMLAQQDAHAWLRAAALLTLGAVLYGVNILVKNRLDRGKTRHSPGRCGSRRPWSKMTRQ